MNIEITKKGLLIIIILVLVLLGVFYLGHSLGYSSGVKNTTQKYENPRGDGEHFYAEKYTDRSGSFMGISLNHSYMVFHSIPNCKAIKNGVTIDRAFKDSLYRVNNSSFCSKCMDVELIKKCLNFLDGSFK